MVRLCLVLSARRLGICLVTEGTALASKGVNTVARNLNKATSVECLNKAMFIRKPEQKPRKL